MSTPKKNDSRLNYKTAGVDINAGEDLVKRIRPFCEKTRRPEMAAGIGGFAGLFHLSKSKYQNPVLVSATDGVGTKLKLAQTLKCHHTIGIDLVAMCVNDVLTHGAEPVLFLDYFACGQLSVEQAAEVIQGVAKGCELAGCALLGGETAELPDMYQNDDYDLAGFCVGLAQEDALCGAHRANPGDKIIGLASNGAHSNGYSLIRKIIERRNADLAQSFGAETLGDALLAPTRIYVKDLLPLIAEGKLEALAHITGGGISNNLPRVLQDGQVAKIKLNSWERPAIFNWLQENGAIEEAEMLRVFNCGIGMALIVKPENLDFVMAQLKQRNCPASAIGEVAGEVIGESEAQEKAHVVYE